MLNLPSDHPGLHLLQQIRDEAHRFAIQGHRARRAKARTTSTLQEIAGIGATRRKALLQHFGGVKGVQAASVEDIAARAGHFARVGGADLRRAALSSGALASKLDAHGVVRCRSTFPSRSPGCGSS